MGGFTDSLRRDPQSVDGLINFIQNSRAQNKLDAQKKWLADHLFSSDVSGNQSASGNETQSNLASTPVDQELNQERNPETTGVQSGQPANTSQPSPATNQKPGIMRYPRVQDIPLGDIVKALDLSPEQTLQYAGQRDQQAAQAAKLAAETQKDYFLNEYPGSQTIDIRTGQPVAHNVKTFAPQRPTTLQEFINEFGRSAGLQEYQKSLIEQRQAGPQMSGEQARQTADYKKNVLNIGGKAVKDADLPNYFEFDPQGMPTKTVEGLHGKAKQSMRQYYQTKMAQLDKDLASTNYYARINQQMNPDNYDPTADEASRSRITSQMQESQAYLKALNANPNAAPAPTPATASTPATGTKSVSLKSIRQQYPKATESDDELKKFYESQGFQVNP